MHSIVAYAPNCDLDVRYKKMKKYWKLIVGLAVGCLLTAYLSGPIFAGSRQIGDRLGPRIYPRGLHESLFIIAHESAHNIKPRVSIDSQLYNRPWFYGQRRTPKSKEKREAFLERLRQNQSPMLDLMTERNKIIDEGEQNP